ncbi:hypothetical protein NBH00_01335 [Paraconexibacter antarcticus]|uniref:Uncharacterized protein n=1 Tax=Paraconexibacter antarcticus TaxID=2949664 RepID=A0ABY5DS59_9ACTN|nr:hypothetical protein [Paraconexibacter antarcticus]UTI64863.1 hypothetical protein NBH00_01335 [Paraconexibacter antarcticus]
MSDVLGIEPAQHVLHCSAPARESRLDPSLSCRRRVQRHGSTVGRRAPLDQATVHEPIQEPHRR